MPRRVVAEPEPVPGHHRADLRRQLLAGVVRGGEALFDPLDQGRPVEPACVPGPVPQLVQRGLVVDRTGRELVPVRQDDAFRAQVLVGPVLAGILDRRSGPGQHPLRLRDGVPGVHPGRQLAPRQAVGVKDGVGIRPGPVQRHVSYTGSPSQSRIGWPSRSRASLRASNCQNRIADPFAPRLQLRFEALPLLLQHGVLLLLPLLAPAAQLALAPSRSRLWTFARRPCRIVNSRSGAAPPAGPFQAPDRVSRMRSATAPECQELSLYRRSHGNFATISWGLYT